MFLSYRAGGAHFRWAGMIEGEQAYCLVHARILALRCTRLGEDPSACGHGKARGKIAAGDRETKRCSGGGWAGWK
jgi:hypothetical protein